MKKILLINALLSFSLIIAAQTPKPQNTINISDGAKKAYSIKSKVKPIGGDEFISNKSRNLNTLNTLQSSFSTSVVGTVVGTSNYDLQSNSAVARRIINYGDSTLTAIWTYSNTTGGYTDRGTGYNYFNGTAWGSNPTKRLETIRTGWPNIGLLGNGKEYLIAHDAADYDFEQGTNVSKGVSPWTFTESLGGGKRPGKNTIWGRIGIAGPGDSTIHLISNYSEDSVIINNVAAPFVYSRSLDGGVTWDSNGVALPGYDDTRTLRGGADDYAIDAAGNNVAILLGGLGEDVTLWKSTNNGDSFTKIYVDSFPYAPDYSANAPFDVAIPTNDGSVTVALDKSGKTHVAYGYSEVENNSNSGAVFFPGSIGLIYWNEYFDSLISVPIMLEDIDANNNGIFDVGSNTTQSTGGAARYGNNSVLNKPSIALDTNGFIYIIFSLPQDADLTTGGATPENQSFRDIWLVTSIDTGKTWSKTFNLTKTKQIEESFASAAKLADSLLHIIYQEDNEPGTTLTNDDPQSSNTIKYLAVAAKDYLIMSPKFAYTSICDSLDVSFQNNTITYSSSTTYSWDFGDTTTNADTSSLENPTYTYPGIGRYTVKCTASNPNGYSEVYIKDVSVAGNSPVANITNKNNCSKDASFADASANFPGNWSWNFGDLASGINNISDLEKPSHKFTSGGTYAISLIATNACGSDTIADTVLINQSPAITNFTADADTVKVKPGVGAIINFNATTTGAISWFWSFGDGNTSTSQNPTYTYTTVLDTSYTVTLVATSDSGCTDTLTKVEFITTIDATGIKELSNDNYNLTVYPNPTFNKATIKYNVTINNSSVKIGIYNLLGVKVYELAKEKQLKGEYFVDFNFEQYAKTGGIYFCTLDIDGVKTTKKLIHIAQ